MKVFSVDIGTSSLKAGIIDSDGNLHACLAIPYWDKSKTEKWDPLLWFNAFRDAAATLDVSNCDAVAVCGNGPTVVALDEQGEAVFPAMLWLNGRNDKGFKGSSFFLPKIKWLQKNHPQVYDKTAVFTGCPSYICYLLTGVVTETSPNESFDSYIWSNQEIIDAGIQRNRLPELQPMTEPVGKVHARASMQTGLRQGIPVYSCGADFLMALCGTASLSPGRVCDRAGSSEGINYCCKKPSDIKGLRSLPHVIEGLFNIAGILPSTGRLFEWYRRLSGHTNTSYEALLHDIEKISVRNNDPWFFSNLTQLDTYSFTTGVFSGLSEDNNELHLGRAIVESIGYEVRSIISHMETNGYVFDTMRLCGGQARTPIWCRMKADITGKEILTGKVNDAELLGNVCCVISGNGTNSSLQDTAEQLYRIDRKYTPDPGRHAEFSEAYSKYTHMLGGIRDIQLLAKKPHKD